MKSLLFFQEQVSGKKSSNAGSETVLGLDIFKLQLNLVI